MVHLIRQMGYVVIGVPDPERSARDLADITGVRVTGLRPGKVYRFTVIEKNALGTSPESAKSNKVRPRR